VPAESRLARFTRVAAGLPLAARISLAVLAVLVAGAIVGPLVSTWDPTETLGIVRFKNTPPSLSHIFGTDSISRDVLSRVLSGARVSLSVAALSVLLSATVGTFYGVVAGYAGGWVDTAMMRLIDALLSIPRILLLIAVLALWDPVGLPGLILLIGLTGWFDVSRIVRGQTLALRNREFVIAARSLGAGSMSIVRRHVLPNVLSPVIVAGTLAVGNVILLEAALSFLGIGVREPHPSWGGMFQDAGASFQTAWWPVLFPGLAIVITVLAVNTLGDALRDVLDPRQLHHHTADDSPEPRRG
jgi:peptide/nickel transport system permease protein